MGENKEGAASVFRTGKQRIHRREVCEATAAAAVGAIVPGCEIFTLSSGHWNLIDLIHHALSATGPADLVVCVWTVGSAETQMLHDLMKKGVVRSVLMLVDYSFPARQPEYCAYVRKVCGDDSIAPTNVHCKFILLSNADWKISILTSANLNRNFRIESYLLSTEAGLHDFLLDFSQKVKAGSLSFGVELSEHKKRFKEQFGDVSFAEGNAGTIFSDRDYARDIMRAGLHRGR